MNKHKLIQVISFVLLAVNAFYVQAETKIGFVNTVVLMKKAPQAEVAKNELEKEFAPRDQAIVAAQKELKQMEDWSRALGRPQAAAIIVAACQKYLN